MNATQITLYSTSVLSKNIKNSSKELEKKKSVTYIWNQKTI